MKRLLLPAVAITLLMLSFSSCEKCKTCTVTVTTTVEGLDPVTASTESEYCGDALKEVDGETVTTEANGTKSETKYECE